MPLHERFVAGRLSSPEHHIFRCIVQYGYKDARRDSHNFETQLLMKVAEFIPQEGNTDMAGNASSVMVGMVSDQVVRHLEVPTRATRKKRLLKGCLRERMKAKVQELVKKKESEVSYIIGHKIVSAYESSSVVKRTEISICWFLRRNSRRPAVSLGLSHTSVVQVGMVYRL
jgi:KUP system potassium uptake protein